MAWRCQGSERVRFLMVWTELSAQDFWLAVSSSGWELTSCPWRAFLVAEVLGGVEVWAVTRSFPYEGYLALLKPGGDGFISSMSRGTFMLIYISLWAQRTQADDHGSSRGKPWFTFWFWGRTESFLNPLSVKTNTIVVFYCGFHVAWLGGSLPTSAFIFLVTGHSRGCHIWP